MQQILNTNKDCYLTSIEENYLYKCVANHLIGKGYNEVPFVCIDNKEFAGLAMIPLMRLLMSLREDKNVLLLLVNAVDAIKDKDDSLVNTLASDIIENLFANFVSVKDNVKEILDAMEFLISNTYIKFTGEGAVFETNKFFNRLIKAFLERAENKQYLSMLFKSTLEQLSHVVQTESTESSNIGEPASNLIKYCDQLIESITSKVDYMPIGIRYLAKIIKDKIEVRVRVILGR